MAKKHYSLPAAERKQRLREIAAVFSKLGSIAFGGPAAHIAITGRRQSDTGAKPD